MSTTSKFYPFWEVSNNNTYKLLPFKLVSFLSANGFGYLRTSASRTDKRTLFKNENGILQLHNSDTVKKWLITYVNITERENDELLFSLNDVLVKLNTKTLYQYLQQLKEYSNDGLENSEVLKQFRDTKDTCYIPFKNGVVRIRKNKIDLINFADVKDSGGIWETSILKHNVSINKFREYSDNSSLFAQFVWNSMKHNVYPTLDINAGTDTEDFQKGIESVETSLGYLTHNFNKADESKLIVFIDKDSSRTNAEGGNGKSLVQTGVTKIRKHAFIDGKGFKSSRGDASRFNFSNVKLDTQLVWIDDLNPDFDLTQMFSMITGDFTVEGKGTNKVVIPREKKPKFSVTTNYVIKGTGHSYQRRQHITEFGNFFNAAGKDGKDVSEILGKRLFDDFSNEEWNDFYNYMFYCIQKYLKKGLVAQDTSDYQKKQLLSEVGGNFAEDEKFTIVTNWIDKFLKTIRMKKNIHTDGCSISDLYEMFSSDSSVTEMTRVAFTRDKFLNTMFDYISKISKKTHGETFIWNAELISKGNTRSARRWRKGTRGNQVEWVKITGSNDNTSNNTTNDDDDMPEIFKQLAG